MVPSKSNKLILKTNLPTTTAIEELTYENVHEFIDRILIHELDKETNTRKIEIFYSFVGRVDTGDKPTESISYFRQIGADVKSYAI